MKKKIILIGCLCAVSFVVFAKGKCINTSCGASVCTESTLWQNADEMDTALLEAAADAC